MQTINNYQTDENMKTFYHLLIALLSLCPTFASAQENSSDIQRDLPDCLRYEEYIDLGYEQLLIRTLMPYNDAEFKHCWDCGLICCTIFEPSFNAESCLYINQDDKGYYLEACDADESIWHKTYNIRYKKHKTKYKDSEGNTQFATSYTKQKFRWDDIKADVKVNRHRLRISKEQYQAILRLYAVAVNTATSFVSPTMSYGINPNETGEKRYFTSMGLDGEITRYVYNGRFASCWSPSQGSKRERLNFLFSRIGEAAFQQDTSLIDKEMDEIKSLTNEFRELLPAWAKDYFDNVEKL